MSFQYKSYNKYIVTPLVLLHLPKYQETREKNKDQSTLQLVTTKLQRQLAANKLKPQA